MDQLLTTCEAATYIGVTSDTLARAVFDRFESPRDSRWA